MKIDKAKQVLEVLQGVDINECAVFAEGDYNQIRGISTDRSTIVYTDFERFIDTQVGILSVKGLLSRINLFDMEKVGVKEETRENEKGGDYISELTIKEGRRRSKVKTTHPNELSVPTKYPDADKVFTAFVTKEYIDYMGKMKASISAVPSQDDLTFTLGYGQEEAESENIALSIGGGYDNFRDVVEGEVSGDSEYFYATWKIEPVMRVLKRAANTLDHPEDTLSINVNEFGIMEVNANDVIVSIVSTNTDAK